MTARRAEYKQAGRRGRFKVEVLSRGQVHLLLLLLAVIAAVRVDGHFRWDDAFITFRMARNIGNGHGWTYNPGTSQDAATGALWTLLLAGFAWLHIGLVGASNVLTTVFIAGAAILVFEILDLLGARTAGMLAGVLVASSEFLMLNNGMELPMAVFLVSLTGYFAVRGRLVLSGVVAGFGILTRGDVALYVAILAVALTLRWRRQVWRFVAGFTAVLLPWAVIAMIIIGHVLPDTLTAKMNQGRSGFWSGSASYFGFLRLVPTTPPTGSGHSEVWFVAIIAFGMIGLVALIMQPRLRPVLVLVTFGIVYTVIYGQVLRVPGYTWYYTMPVFAVIVVAGIGLDLFFRVLWRSNRPRNIAALSGALLLGVVSLVGTSPTIPRLASYSHAAQWLNRNTSPHATVAAAEIGVMGWDSPNRTIIDYLGLTSNTAAEKVRQRDMLWWAYAYQPDYWMTLYFPIDHQLLKAPWFTKAFKPVWSDQESALFQRVGPIPAQS